MAQSSNDPMGERHVFDQGRQPWGCEQRQRSRSSVGGQPFRVAGESVIFRLSPPQQVFALKRGDRLHSVGAADGLHAGLGQAEMFHLPGLNQFFHGAGDVLECFSKEISEKVATSLPGCRGKPAGLPHPFRKFLLRNTLTSRSERPCFVTG